MSEYVIVTDSCCDLPADLAKQLQIEVLPLSYLIKGTDYKNYLDERELKSEAFYAMVREGNQATTSAVNADAFLNSFEGFLSKGIDILSISFSSALSATYSASVIAQEELKAKYPERNIFTVDSLCASSGQGLLVYLCAMQKMLGKSIEDVRDYAEEYKHKTCHWFTVDDLNHLHRGGRVSKASAVLGSMLSIKPVLHVDIEGRLINVSKARGRKKSLEELVDRMKQTAIDPASQTVFLSHADCLEDAESTAEMIRSSIGVKEIKLCKIGPVIGAHSGPGTVALFFIGSPR